MRASFDRAAVLRAVPLFTRLGAEELIALAELAEPVAVPAGARVFGEGEPGDALYLVVRGRLAVERAGVRLAEVGTGECVGELALLDDAPRFATLIALEPAELLRLDRDDFLDTLLVYPAVGRAVLAVLARRLRGGGTVAPGDLRRTVAWEP